jgi:hypothetical protein
VISINPDLLGECTREVDELALELELELEPDVVVAV